MKLAKAIEESTAYHEAGHLVAAYFLGIPLAKIAVTIVPDESAGNLGSFMHRLLFRAGELEFGDSDRTKLKAERLAQVCLAGTVVQQRYRPSSVPHWQSTGDYRQAQELITLISGSQAQAQAYLNLILVRTQEMFNDPYRWRCVDAVAGGLLEKKTLSREEAVTLMLEVLRS
jgi:hypothetical protein